MAASLAQVTLCLPARVADVQNFVMSLAARLSEFEDAELSLLSVKGSTVTDLLTGKALGGGAVVAKEWPGTLRSEGFRLADPFYDPMVSIIIVVGGGDRKEAVSAFVSSAREISIDELELLAFLMKFISKSHDLSVYSTYKTPSESAQRYMTWLCDNIPYFGPNNSHLLSGETVSHEEHDTIKPENEEIIARLAFALTMCTAPPLKQSARRFADSDIIP